MCAYVENTTLMSIMNEKQTPTDIDDIGCIEITMPLHIKLVMLEWSRRTELESSDFFRIALMIGVNELSERLQVKDKTEGYYGQML